MPAFVKFRYVDDTFLLFKRPEHAELFLNYLNSKHPNITFTCEAESSNSLPFLDINITRTGSAFKTSIYRKSTFSGQGISFFSFCFFNFKVNAIKTLVYRAYHLCSSYLDFHEEIEFLKNFFVNNGFPCNLFYSIVRNFLNNRYNSVENLTEENKKMYFSLLYFGYQSEKNEIRTFFLIQ